MEQIKSKDFKIVPDFNSIRNLEISDDEYFSPKYEKYISNSRLKYINPEQGGNPLLFKENPKITSQSLRIGSCIHELLLQPESFELAPKVGKPGAKLGNVIDYIERGLNDGLDLTTAIKSACVNAEYYVNSIDKKIDQIKQVWQEFSSRVSEIRALKKDKEQIILSDSDWDLVNSCVNSCKENEEIFSKLHPKNAFGEDIESHFEDALFIDFIVIYKEHYCTTLKFKLKIDNWTIDFDNKVVTLNDLKTTGKSVNKFIDPDGSMTKFHYYRQMACYGAILWYFCMKKYGISKEQGWKLDTNMLVVETIPHYWSRSYYVTNNQLRQGKIEFEQLMKRVCYAELFGYDKEIDLI